MMTRMMMMMMMIMMKEKKNDEEEEEEEDFPFSPPETEWVDKTPFIQSPWTKTHEVESETAICHSPIR